MLSEVDLTLKKCVLRKCGITSISARDCRLISEEIFNLDKNYISETTIKRFFGIMESKGTFSPFVYNSLCIFCGFNGYDDFKTRYENGEIKNS